MRRRRRSGYEDRTEVEALGQRCWGARCGGPSQRAARVELTVHTTNERGVSLYRRHGFEVEGTRRGSLLVNGRLVDEYRMSVTSAV